MDQTAYNNFLKSISMESAISLISNKDQSANLQFFLKTTCANKLNLSLKSSKRREDVFIFSGTIIEGLLSFKNTPCELEVQLVKGLIEMKLIARPGQPFLFSSQFEILPGTLFDEMHFNNAEISFDSQADNQKDFEKSVQPNEEDSKNFNGPPFRFNFLGIIAREELPGPVSMLTQSEVLVKGYGFILDHKSVGIFPKIILKSEEQFEIPILKNFSSQKSDLNFFSFLPKSDLGDSDLFPECFGQLSFKKNFNVNKKSKSLTFAARFYSKRPFSISFSCSKTPDTSALNFNDLLTAFDGLAPKGTALETYFPKNFPVAKNISFERIDFNIVFNQYLIPELQSVDLEFSLTGSWNILKLANVSSLRAYFRIAGPMTANPMIFLNLSGDIIVPSISKKFLAISINLPSTEFSIGPTDEMGIDITSFLSKDLKIPAIDNLQKIICTRFTINGQITENTYGFTAMIEGGWKIDLLGEKLTISDLVIRVFPIGNSMLPSLSGNFSYRGLEFFMGAFANSDKTGWELQGLLKEGEIDLTEQLAKIGIDAIPQIAVTNLKLTYNTNSKKVLIFLDTDFKFKTDFFPDEINFQVRVKPDKPKNTIDLVSEILIGDQLFQISTAINKKIERLEAKWIPDQLQKQSLSIDKFLNNLVGKLPNGFPKLELLVQEISILNDTNSKSIAAIIKLENDFSAQIFKGKDQDNTDILVAIVAFSLTDVSFSKALKIEAFLKPFKNFTPKNMMFIYSTGQISSAKFSGLPSADDVLNPIFSVNSGISIVADIGIDMIKLPLIKEMLGDKNIFRVCLNGSAGLAQGLQAKFDSDIHLPTPKFSLFSIINPELTISVGQATIKGNANINVFGADLSADNMSVSINSTGASGSAKLAGELPGIPGLSGISFKDMQLIFGTSPTGPVVGAIGKVQIGEDKNKNNPFALLLNPAQGGGTVPQYLAFSAESIGFEEIFQILLKRKISFPIPLKLEDVAFNWSAQKNPQTLPDGTSVEPGLSLYGTANFLGLKFFADIKAKMEISEPVKAVLEVSPIVLPKIIEITGKGKGRKQQRDKNNKPLNARLPVPDKSEIKTVQVISPGGPVFIFEPTYGSIKGSANVNFLGISSTNTTIEISTNGAEFTLKQSVGRLGKLTFKCRLKSIEEFSVNVKESVDLDFKLRIKPPLLNKITGDFKVHIKAKVDLEIQIDVAPKKKSYGTISATLEFMKVSIPLSADIDINDLKNVNSLEKKLIGDLSNKLKKFFTNPDNYLKAFGKNLLSAIKNPKKLLSKGFKLGEKAASEALKRLGLGKAVKKIKKVFNPSRW